MTRIVVHIDRLVLKGFHPAQAAILKTQLAQQFQQALQREGMNSPLVTGGSRSEAHAAPVPLNSGAPSAELGQRIAAAVIQGARK